MPTELASLAQLALAHRRHDEVMEALLAAARRLAAGRPDRTDVDIVRGVVEYFEDVVPRQFLDEEGSVFPRLSTRRPELAEALAALSADHPVHIALQGEIAAVAAALDGESRPTTGLALLEAATKLVEMYRGHVAREDAVLAGANEALTAEDDAEIVAEMATRRDRETIVAPPPPPQAKAKTAKTAKTKATKKSVKLAKKKLAKRAAKVAKKPAEIAKKPAKIAKKPRRR